MRCWGQQEEEEWKEVLAQQDSFQQAAEPVGDATQTIGNPGNSPIVAHGPGALTAAQAPAAADAAGRDSLGESMHAGALMPGAKDQDEAMAVSLPCTLINRSCMICSETARQAV